jgi:hypothetical protein
MKVKRQRHQRRRLRGDQGHDPGWSPLSLRSRKASA